MSDDDHGSQSGDNIFVEGTSSTGKTVDDVPSAEDAATRLDESSGVEAFDEPEELDTVKSLSFRSDYVNRLTHNRMAILISIYYRMI